MHSYNVWFFIISLNTIHANFDTDLNLLLKICNMKFCDATKTDCDLNFCDKQMSSEIKLGDCPRRVNNTETDPNNSCYDDCSNDYRCSSAFKCCWMNSCNRSCIMAENLNRISIFTLPSIPINVSVISVERDARRKAKIIWLMRMPHNHHHHHHHHHHDDDGHIEYIIEARSHIGNTFFKYKFGQWFVVQAENIEIESMHSHHFKLSCWVSLQIGRFYEFRIAAFNGNGTRGYSETDVFQLNEKPKTLPMPINLTIDSLPIRMPNNSVYTRLIWQEPNSDYPIEKYEVTYSRYINEDGNKSLFMERLRIPVTQNFIEFYDLMPDSYYYVQVNTLTSFGRKKIRSDKMSVIINTTISNI